jgi:cation:H+ antiporter
VVVDVILLAVGLVVLARAADLFVLGASRISVTMRVSPLVTGAVVVGFGTGLPELLVSGLAAAEDDLDIAVGNIVGSNLANLTLVLGVAGLMVQPRVTSGILRREAPLSLGAMVLFAVVVQNGLTRWEGVLLLAALAAALFVMLRVAQAPSADATPVTVPVGAPAGPPEVADAELAHEVEDYVEHGVEHDLDEVRRAPNGPDIRRTLVGLAGTVLGAQLLVTAARSIADELDLSGGFVGVTLVAIGTSLPELVTGIQSARRNQTALLIGNVLGSNMFNSLAVGGVAALIGPASLDNTDLTTIATGLMVVIAFLTWAFLAVGRRLVRWEAVAMLALYLATLPLLA